MRDPRRRLALGAVALLLAAGCSAGADPEPPSTGGTGAAGIPVTVENCGRTLTFEQPPSRVVTSYYPTLETMIVLGLEDSVIGRARFSDPDGFLPGHEQIYDAIPEVDENGYLPPKEDLLALAPDLVVSEGWYNFDAESGYATVEELEAAGSQVFILGGWCSAEETNDYTLQGALDDLTVLGEIFGAQDRAAEVVAELEAGLADVEERVGDLEPLRVIVADASAESFSALGQGLGNELIERAGGINVFADADDYFEVSLEEVAAADAQAYAVVDYVPLTPEERIAVIETVAPDSEGVREQRYAVINAVAIHPGYRPFLAIEQIARVLHPEAFDD